MRRPTAVLALVALCLLFSLAGCRDPGDVKKAEALLEQGADACEKLQGGFLDLVDEMEKFFAGYAERVITSRSEIRARIHEYRERLRLVLEQSEQAKGPFKEVLAMEGVPHYKDFAKLMLKVLAQIDKTQDVFDRTVPLIEQALRAGKGPDANGVQGAKRELIGIEMEMSFIEAEAEQVAEDIDLPLSR